MTDPSLSLTTPSSSRRPTRKTQVARLLSSTELDAQSFARRWGIAALLHRPTQPELDRAMLQTGTVPSQHANVVGRILAMVRAFRHMEVEFLSTAAEGALTLGRGPEAGLMFDNPTVSKSHATVGWAQGRFWVNDQGSTNGTFVNARKVAALQTLSDGDTLTLGDVELVFVTSGVLYLQLSSLAPGLRGS